MNHAALLYPSSALAPAIAAVLVFADVRDQAATLWTGPTIQFRQSPVSESDAILPGKVVLTRGSNQGLFNTAAGETSAGPSSPADTEWAFGNLAEFATLTYQSLESMRNGDLAARILSQPMVMHLINEDIYLSVRFSFWGQHFSGGFAYTRSTPATNSTPPSVNITSPSPGAAFAAPATFDFAVNATAKGGSVTNVEFFANATALGSASAAPFQVLATIPEAGAYALTAVATASGVSSTSGVVSISVISPNPVTLSAPSLSAGIFSFTFSADSGLAYVVENSSDLLNWVPVSTNRATANSIVFTDRSAMGAVRFYRVARLSNP
jgi:hypothetical protein